MLIGQPERFQQILVQPGQRHLVQNLRRIRPGFLESQQAVHAGTRHPHHPFHALDRQAGIWLLDLRLLQVQHELYAHSVLRVPLEQERFQRTAGRIPDPRRISTSRVSASHTMSSATARRFCAADGACTTTIPGSSPPGSMLPPVSSDQPEQQSGRRTVAVRGGQFRHRRAADGEGPRYHELLERRAVSGRGGREGRPVAADQELQLHHRTAVAVVEPAGSGIRRQREHRSRSILGWRRQQRQSGAGGRDAFLE